jgi:hypothetical protein
MVGPSITTTSRHLLEAAHQLGRSHQVADRNLGGLLHVLQEACELGATQTSLGKRMELLDAINDGGHCHEPVAQGRVELVRDTSHQLPQSRQLL